MKMGEERLPKMVLKIKVKGPVGKLTTRWED